MWQWFRMTSVGFKVLCLSHGLPKAQTNDCFEKTIRICSVASKMPIKEGSGKEERTWWRKGILRRMQDEMDYLADGLQQFQPKCYILSTLNRICYRGGKPVLMADRYFLWFHKVFCLCWSGFYTTALDILSNEVVLQSFPTVLKYSMCWLSQLNESEFIYKSLCFAIFFFSSLFHPSLSKTHKLFVEGKTYKQCDSVQ